MLNIVLPCVMNQGKLQTHQGKLWEFYFQNPVVNIRRKTVLRSHKKGGYHGDLESGELAVKKTQEP